VQIEKWRTKLFLQKAGHPSVEILCGAESFGVKKSVGGRLPCFDFGNHRRIFHNTKRLTKLAM
jgi:hypothetical protein